MNKPNDAASANNGVAMFIDWENMHGFIRGKANISALREVAEGYGRLVLAKAYADWREPRFQQDSLVLYKIGVEPVYVPEGFKNNADLKLATDCIDCAYKYPNIEVFILVTGDGDFIHIATTLRPLGKRVVVIAQSSNASSRLVDLVDTLLIYDKDVNPVASLPAQQGIEAKRAQTPRKLAEVYSDIVDIIREEKGAPILLTNVKQKLIRKYGRFNQEDYGFEKFKTLIEAGAQKGSFFLNTAGLRDWLTLQMDDVPTARVELPENITKVYEEIVCLIQSSNQSQALLSFIKHSLIKKYGGFDEAVYGYNQFKEMVEEGERQGYFKMGINDKQVYYAYLDKELEKPVQPEELQRTGFHEPLNGLEQPVQTNS